MIGPRVKEDTRTEMCQNIFESPQEETEENFVQGRRIIQLKLKKKKTKKKGKTRKK